MAGHVPRTLAACAALLAVLVFAASSAGRERAETAFPGKNGKLAYAAGLRSAAGDIPLDLYALPAAGGKAVKLVAGGAGGSWSPDGTRIAYTAGEATTEVYLLDATTGATAQVTKNAYNEGSPSWSPDGKRLVFSRRVGPMDTPFRIVTASASGGDERTVHLRAREPSWSPDGKRFAFVGDDWPQVFIMGSDGGGVRRLTSGFLWAVNPEWSPDGRKLAFAALASNSKTPQIYVIGADGAGLRQVTTSAGEKGAPAWSPDGTELAFTNAEPHGIFVIPVGGGTERRLTPGASKLYYYDLSWQPVGPATAKGAATVGDNSGTARLPCTIDGATAGRWRISVLPGTRKEIRLWQIDGTDGNDVICGTLHNDLIFPGKGNDVVYAGTGDDTVNVSTGDDRLFGEAGSDSLYDGDGADLIAGGTGKDFLNADDHFGSSRPAADTVLGGAGDDEIATHDETRDVVDGGAGFDKANTDPGIDVVTNVEQAVGPGGQPLR